MSFNSPNVVFLNPLLTLFDRPTVIPPVVLARTELFEPKTTTFETSVNIFFFPKDKEPIFLVN